MEISKKNIKSYKKIHLKLYKEELSNQQAYESLFNLIGFYKTLEKINRRIRLEKELLNKHSIEKQKVVLVEKVKERG